MTVTAAGALRAGVLVIVALAAYGVVPVAAQGADPAKVEELIKKANDYRRQGHDQRAMPLLKEAYEIARTPRTAAQLGLVELALGYWSAAEEHLTEALQSVKHHPWVDKNRDTLEKALRSSKSHLAELTVEGKPAGAQMSVNGKAVGTLPLPGPIKVNEGRIEVELRAPGHRTATRSLTLAGEARERLSIELVPGAEPGVPTSEDSRAAGPSSASPSSTASGAGIAGGAGSGSVGLGSGAAASGAAGSVTSGSAGTGSGPMNSATTPDESGSTSGAPALPTWRRVLPWTLVAGAVIAGSVGVWQHLAWRDNQNDFESIPGCGASAPGHGTDPRCDDLYGDLSANRNRAYVGYAVAAAFGVGAATSFILNAAADRSGDARGGGVAVAVGSRGMHVSYRLSF